MKQAWRRRLSILLAAVLCISVLSVEPVYAEQQRVDIPSVPSFDDTLGGMGEIILGESIKMQSGCVDGNVGAITPDSYSDPYVGADESLGIEGEVVYPENSDTAIAGMIDRLEVEETDDLPLSLSKGPKLSASKTSVSMKRGETLSVTMSASGFGGAIYLNFGTNNTTAYSASWGDWYESGDYWKIPLRITGDAVGQGTITVNMCDSDSGRTLATVYITVKVASSASPRVEVSRSSLSLAEGAETQIIVSLIEAYGVVSVAYGTSNDAVIGCEWGDWVDSNIPLKIRAKAPGSATITVTLWDSNDREIARAYVNVSVYRKDNPKISLSSSSISLKTGNSKTISMTCSGYSGDYYLQYGTTNDNAFNVEWGSWDSYDAPAYMTVTGRNPGSGTITIYMKDDKNDKVLDSKTISVTISPNGSPKVTVSKRSVSLAAGASERIAVGYENLYEDAYINIFSDNDNVVTCGFTGDWYGNKHDIILYAQKPGNATVYVTMKRSSNDETLSTAQIAVTTSGFRMQDVGFGFGNYSENISLDLCEYMFGDNLKAREVYEENLGGGGVCYGMASGAALIVDSLFPNVDSFDIWKTSISKLNKWDRSSVLNLSISDFIEVMHVSQVVTPKRPGLSALVSTVIRETDAGRMVRISVRGELNGEDAGHSVLAFGYRQVSDREIAIRIYDSNYVDSPNKMQETTLTVQRPSSTGNYTSWSYPFASNITWGTNRRYNSIGYSTLMDIQSVWQQRGSHGNNSLNLISTSEDDFSLYNFDGKLVVKYENGTMVHKSDEIIEVELTNVLPDGSTVDRPNMFFAPSDLYTVVDGTPGSPMKMSMADNEMAVQMYTGADEFDICADDASRVANVIMTPGEGVEYSVKLLSMLSGSLEEISVEGFGTGEAISIGLENGELSVVGADNADLSITMPSEENAIEAQAETGGTITPEGIHAYGLGENVMYTIKAADGYKIEAVYVDGENIGPVDTYCFENIQKSHKIYATFVRSMSSFTVQPADSEYIYSGAEWRPEIVVFDADGNQLTENTDYTVSYEDNTEIGTAKVYAVAIQGSGYYGSATATFEIVHGEPAFISGEYNAEDGAVRLLFDHTANATIILAAYDARGSMIEAAVQHVDAGIYTAEMLLAEETANSADTLKAFMLDDTLKPMCRPIVIDLQ